MGYTDERGIYFPQHGEDGWSDEMNANLSILSAALPVSMQYPACNATWYRNNPGPGIFTAQNNTYYAGDPGQTPPSLHDPSGLFPASSYVSSWWGLTFPQWSWGLLPPGVWMLTAEAAWAEPNGFRTQVIDILDDHTAEDGYIAVNFGGANDFQTTATTTGQSTMITSHLLTVPYGATRRVGLILRQVTGAPVLVSALGMRFHKIGN